LLVVIYNYTTMYVKLGRPSHISVANDNLNVNGRIWNGVELIHIPQNTEKLEGHENTALPLRVP